MDFRVSLSPGTGAVRSQYTVRPTEPFRSTSPFSVPFASERRFLQNSAPALTAWRGVRTRDDAAPFSRATAIAALQTSHRNLPPQFLPSTAPAGADVHAAATLSPDDDAAVDCAAASGEGAAESLPSSFSALLHTSARAPAALPGDPLLRRTGVLERASDAEVSRIAGGDGSVVDAAVADGVVRSWSFWAESSAGQREPVCVWRTAGARFGCYNVIGPHATLCALFGQHRVAKEFAGAGTSVRQWAPARTI
jgi:hypothetical protein